MTTLMLDVHVLFDDSHGDDNVDRSSPPKGCPFTSYMMGPWDGLGCKLAVDWLAFAIAFGGNADD